MLMGRIQASDRTRHRARSISSVALSKMVADALSNTILTRLDADCRFGGNRSSKVIRSSRSVLTESRSGLRHEMPTSRCPPPWPAVPSSPDSRSIKQASSHPWNGMKVRERGGEVGLQPREPREPRDVATIADAWKFRNSIHAFTRPSTLSGRVVYIWGSCISPESLLSLQYPA